MPYERYRNTPLVTWELSDALDTLESNGYIPTEVNAAAHLAPLRFSRSLEPGFFEERSWWRAPLNDSQNAADIVLRKFDHWYKIVADNRAKAWLSFIALTNTYEAIDGIVDRTINILRRQYRTEYLEADGSQAIAYDYEKILDPDILAMHFNTPKIHWWCQNVEAQIKRIVEVPPCPIADMMVWYTVNLERRNRITDYFHANTYVRTGISPKKARKILARSFNLLKGFCGRHEAFRFIHGGELRIERTHFTWGIQLEPDKIITNTIDPPKYHTPFTICLYNKEGQRLCNGCILWRETPVFDQAVGFMLATNDPDEELEVFTQMNISRYTDAAKEHDLVGERQKVEVSRYGQPIDPEALGVPFEVREVVMPETMVAEPPERVEVETVFVGRGNSMLDYDGWDDWGEGGLVEDPMVEPEPLPGVNNLSDTAWFEYIETTPDAPLNTSDVIERRHNVWRARRKADPVICRVQNMLFDQIDAPREILEYMGNPEYFYYWNRRTKRQPPVGRVASYISTKRFQ